MRRVFAALVTAVLIASASPVVAQTAPAHKAENLTLVNPKDGQKIAITVFTPSAVQVPGAADVPVILQSHGWGGTRTAAVSGDVRAMLDAGFGVVSIDQRGHGQSGGQAHVQDPTRETEDIKTVIDYIAGVATGQPNGLPVLDWVAHNTDPSGAPIADDPILGAIGGSYGGGYQTMTTLDELADEGRTRFDALAPEITWYDLPESLAPQRVPRTAWTAVLYAAGARMLPQYVHEGQIWGASTGQWPDGTVYGQPVAGVPNLQAEFAKHSPRYFAEQGIKINVPMMIRQGTSDNLFNLNEGLDIFHKALTDEAREQSYFVAFNGGHALPNAAPPGEPMAAELGGGVDACSGNWTQLRIDFFRRVFAGENTEDLLPNQYNFTDVAAPKDNAKPSDCIRFDAIDPTRTVEVDPLGTGTIATPTAAGAPLHLEVAEGPLTVTGVPQLSGTLAAAGLDSRAFFGLSTGTSPADAKVVQNNLMPLRQILPTTATDFDIKLPGVAVNVPAGEKLFLTITPFSDMFFGHGSRTPGAMVLSDLSLTLPKPGVVAEEEPEPVASAMSLVVEGKGSKSRLVATLTDANGGAGISDAPVEFFVNGAPLGAGTTDGNGVASITLDGRYRGGSHTFEGRFAGNEAYRPSSASTTT